MNRRAFRVGLVVLAALILALSCEVSNRPNPFRRPPPPPATSPAPSPTGVHADGQG